MIIERNRNIMHKWKLPYHFSALNTSYKNKRLARVSCNCPFLCAAKDKGAKSKAFLRVFKYTSGGALEVYTKTSIKCESLC